MLFSIKIYLCLQGFCSFGCSIAWFLMWLIIEVVGNRDTLTRMFLSESDTTMYIKNIYSNKIHRSCTKCFIVDIIDITCTK